MKEALLPKVPIKRRGPVQEPARDLVHGVIRKKNKRPIVTATSQIPQMTLSDLISAQPFGEPTRAVKRRMLQQREGKSDRLKAETKYQSSSGPGEAGKEATQRGTTAVAKKKPSSVAEKVAPKLFVPKIKSSGGRLIIDQESLIVQTGKSQADHEELAEKNYTKVFEKGTYVTSSSFGKRLKPDRWTSVETDLFYEAVRRHGTDFSLIADMFPNKSRRQVRNKYKREEAIHASRIDLVFNDNSGGDQEAIDRLMKMVEESNPKKG